MATQVQLLSITVTPGQLRVLFALAFSGSYASGGDTVDFTTATKAAGFQGPADTIETSQAPDVLDIWSQSGNLANHYYPVIGTTLANNKVKIDTAFNTQAAAGLYSSVAAGVLTDTVVGEAIFNSPML